jgi:hypothetical protein
MPRSFDAPKRGPERREYAHSLDKTPWETIPPAPRVFYANSADSIENKIVVLLGIDVLPVESPT